MGGRARAAVAGVVVLALGLSGCDWPQYLAGPRHTGHNRFERDLGRENVGDLAIAWQAQTLSDTAPAVVGGVVHLDGNAVDAETGADVPVGGPGAYPAVSGRSLLGCAFSGGLTAVDRRTGALRWTVPEASCAGSGLTVAAGTAFVNVGPAPLLGVGAFRVADGSRVWRAQPCPSGTTSQWVPTVADGLAFVTCGAELRTSQTLVAVDARTGRTRWTRELETTAFTSSPAVEGHRLFVGGGGIGFDGDEPPARVFALDTRTGASLWTTIIPEFVGLSAPAVAGRHLYVLATDGRLRSLEVRTGTIGWTASTDVPGFLGSPTVANGVVYTAGFNGIVDAFDNRTGGRLFHTDLATQVFGAGPVVADGTLFVTTSTAGIYAFRPPDQPEPPEQPE